VLPGSKESGALRQSKVRVPPVFVDGLTTLVIPALNATAPVLDVGLLVLLPLPLPLLLHAPSARAATAPSAASPKVLRLIIR
jgi:hypothetical protein